MGRKKMTMQEVAKKESTLDLVLEKLEREFHLPKSQKHRATKLNGEIYTVSREAGQLQYRDKVASFSFEEQPGSAPRLVYSAAAPYLDGVLKLLENTNTAIGRELVKQLASVEMDTPLGEDTVKMLKRVGYDPKDEGRVVSVLKVLELANFDEAYDFIKGHILFP